MKPLVSVMMVCYEAAATLPWAFGSLLAQSIGDWECIFVDDGSSDSGFDTAVTLGDPRIRAFRFDTNRGRGAARQFALEQARGDYLCILDADDWMYPWRLQAEIDVLETEHRAGMISAGMAIVDEVGSLNGIGAGAGSDDRRVFPPMTRLQMPPIAFPPSMIRMTLAKQCRFDPRFKSVEDAEFLMQIIRKQEYGVLDRNLYAYTEHFAVTLEKMIGAYRLVGDVFRSYRASFPLQSRINGLEVIAKSAVYRAAFAVNRSEWLVRRRWRTPSSAEIAEFERARSMVRAKVAEISDTSNQGPESAAIPVRGVELGAEALIGYAEESPASTGIKDVMNL